MNQNNIKRETGANVLRFKKKGIIIDINEDKFLRQHKLDNLIRLNKTEFSNFREKNKYLTHFNLQYCFHNKGDKLALFLIEQHGYYDGYNEVAPVLSLKNSLIAKCLDVKNNISYEELTEDDFIYTYDNINNIDSLKQFIIEKYQISMLKFTVPEILSLGVSVTNLKIIGKMKYRI
jgi:hypothetical protein